MAADAAGLSSEEARRRLAEHGPNELARERGPLAVGAAAGAVRGRDDLAARWRRARSPSRWARWRTPSPSARSWCFNALVGFVQEYRAERAVLALRAMTAPRARVLRDGHAVVVPGGARWCPGDVLLLEAGDVVAADARLLEAHALRDERGGAHRREHARCEKDARAARRARRPLAERTRPRVPGHRGGARDAAWPRSTATGMAHGAGPDRAPARHAPSETQTPLQRRLDARRPHPARCSASAIVARGRAAGARCAGMPLARRCCCPPSRSRWRRCPKGCPAVVTIALALGVQRMAARQRAGAPAAGGRDAGLRDGDLHRQDRHADHRA